MTSVVMQSDHPLNQGLVIAFSQHDFNVVFLVGRGVRRKGIWIFELRGSKSTDTG
jgi:hypothetical protein